MVYNAIDVARYIINYNNKNLNGISNLKLQKILYFVQAYFLSTTNLPCFNDTIEAWGFGPVIPNVYHNFKQFGAMNIPSIETYLEYKDKDNIWSVEEKEFDDSIISPNDKEKINYTNNKLSKYSAYNLIDITHNQSPWKDVYIKGNNNTIKNEAIKNYFDKLQ